MLHSIIGIISDFGYEDASSNLAGVTKIKLMTIVSSKWDKKTNLLIVKWKDGFENGVLRICRENHHTIIDDEYISTKQLITILSKIDIEKTFNE